MVVNLHSNLAMNNGLIYDTGSRPRVLQRQFYKLFLKHTHNLQFCELSFSFWRAFAFAMYLLTVNSDNHDFQYFQVFPFDEKRKQSQFSGQVRFQYHFFVFNLSASSEGVCLSCWKQKKKEEEILSFHIHQKLLKSVHYQKSYRG